MTQPTVILKLYMDKFYRLIQYIDVAFNPPYSISDILEQSLLSFRN